MSLIVDWFRALDAVVDRELKAAHGEVQDDASDAQLDSGPEENPPQTHDVGEDLFQSFLQLRARESLANAIKEQLEKDNEVLENKLHRIGSLLTTHGLGAEQCANIKRIIAEPVDHAEQGQEETT